MRARKRPFESLVLGPGLGLAWGYGPTSHKGPGLGPRDWPRFSIKKGLGEEPGARALNITVAWAASNPSAYPARNPKAPVKAKLTNAGFPLLLSVALYLGPQRLSVSAWNVFYLFEYCMFVLLAGFHLLFSVFLGACALQLRFKLSF